LREVLFVPGLADIADEFLSFEGGPVFDEWTVVEFQLPLGDAVELSLDGIVVYQLFMPVAVGQLHIISDGVGEALALVCVLFTEGLIDNRFYVLSQMVELGMSFGIRKAIRFGLQCFPGRNRIGTGYIELEIGNEEQVIPQLMPEILYIT
jgi:hypothetical protein